MNNITKNLLLALTLVGVIVLIVFSIQLIVLNRGVDPLNTGSVVSGGSDSDENSSDEEDGDEEPDGAGSFDSMADTPRPPPQGTRRDFLVADNTRLVLYSSDELFDFDQGEFICFLRYTGGGLATLDVGFTSVTQGVALHVEAVLNTRSAGTTAEFIGEQSIHGSPIIGYHARTQVGGETYEAWLVNLDNSDVALIITIHYQNDQQRDALYQVLSSLDIE